MKKKKMFKYVFKVTISLEYEKSTQVKEYSRKKTFNKLIRILNGDNFKNENGALRF